MIGNQEEYDLCCRRGHESGSSISDNFVTWDVCKWCGIKYRFGNPVLIEEEIDR